MHVLKLCLRLIEAESRPRQIAPFYDFNVVASYVSFTHHPKLKPCFANQRLATDPCRHPSAEGSAS